MVVGTEDQEDGRFNFLFAHITHDHIKLYIHLYEYIYVYIYNNTCELCSVVHPCLFSLTAVTIMCILYLCYMFRWVRKRRGVRAVYGCGRYS